PWLLRRSPGHSALSLDGSRPAWPRPGPGDEAVREVRVHGQGLADAELLHHHEAQAVGEAVDLVAMPLEVLEGLALFVRRRPVNARELLAVETLAQLGGLVVPQLARQRDV